MADPAVYTLHYFPFSIYSLMVRFGFVLGETLNPETAPNVQIKLVNLHREENFSEKYLTEINKKGQVPSLTSAELPAPLDDSYTISKWLCERQPELMPLEHKEVIERLMAKLYAFHAMALAISQEDRKDGIPNQAAAMLENPDISETHRRALEIKSVVHDTLHGRTAELANIQNVEDQARDFMRDLAEVLTQYNAGKIWIFGDQPTIIDAHATALTARLIDSERYDLIADPVRIYASNVMETEEWKKTTHGRPTLWNISLGHASELTPL